MPKRRDGVRVRWCAPADDGSQLITDDKEKIMGALLSHGIEISVVVTNALVFVSNRWVADEERIPHPIHTAHVRVVHARFVRVVRVKVLRRSHGE